MEDRPSPFFASRTTEAVVLTVAAHHRRGRFSFAICAALDAAVCTALSPRLRPIHAILPPPSRWNFVPGPHRLGPTRGATWKHPISLRAPLSATVHYTWPPMQTGVAGSNGCA